MDREKCPNCKGFLKKIKRDHWYWYCPKCDRKYEEWELYEEGELGGYGKIKEDLCWKKCKEVEVAKERREKEQRGLEEYND